MTAQLGALDLLASFVLEDGKRWGEAAVAEQWQDARCVLDADSPTPYSFLTRARGFSKTADLAGMATAAMLADLPAGSRLYAIASDLDQGRLLVDSVGGFAARTPELAGALVVDAHRVAAARSGCTLEVLAADAPGAYGLRPAFLIVDELSQWAATPGPRRLWEATTSALAKVPGARLVVLSSAGDPAHWSYKVLEHARLDPLWRTHEVPGPPPWVDRDRLAEQRRRLPVSTYARLFDNMWTAAEDRLVDPANLAACVTLDGPLEPKAGIVYRIGVDLGLRADRSVLSVCHAETVPDEGRRVVLDRQLVFAGSRAAEVRLSDVEAALGELARRYRARVTADPWQGVGMYQRLRAGGVHVDEFTFSSASVGRLANTLHLLLRDRLLALPDDPELLDELENVRLREVSPGVLRMDHEAGRHDDRAISLALAATKLLETATGGVTSAAPPPGRRILPPKLGQRLPATAPGPLTRQARLGPAVGRRAMREGRW